MNVSVIGSSDPVRGQMRAGQERGPEALTPAGGGFVQRTIPGESHYLHVFDGCFTIASSKDAALQALKEHQSHPWGENKPLSVCAAF